MLFLRSASFAAELRRPMEAAFRISGSGSWFLRSSAMATTRARKSSLQQRTSRRNAGGSLGSRHNTDRALLTVERVAESGRCQTLPHATLDVMIVDNAGAN